MGKAVFGVRQCFEARGLDAYRRITAKCLIDLLFFYMFIFKKKKACKQLTIYQEQGLSMGSGQGFWKGSGLKI